MTTKKKTAVLPAKYEIAYLRTASVKSLESFRLDRLRKAADSRDRVKDILREAFADMTQYTAEAELAGLFIAYRNSVFERGDAPPRFDSVAELLQEALRESPALPAGNAAERKALPATTSRENKGIILERMGEKDPPLSREEHARRAGLVGGKVSRERLSPEERSESARNAVNARWAKVRTNEGEGGQ